MGTAIGTTLRRGFGVAPTLLLIALQPFGLACEGSETIENNTSYSAVADLAGTRCMPVGWTAKLDVVAMISSASPQYECQVACGRCDRESSYSSYTYYSSSPAPFRIVEVRCSPGCKARALSERGGPVEVSASAEGVAVVDVVIAIEDSRVSAEPRTLHREVRFVAGGEPLCDPDGGSDASDDGGLDAAADAG